MNQSDLSAANRTAWDHSAYKAHVRAHGTPGEEAARICSRGARDCLRYTIDYLGDVAGKHVANLLASHGRKAVPLALLGAEVTAVDISEGNARYARELAAAAGVEVNYIVSDLVNLQMEGLAGRYDRVLMELGIAHYFVDLAPLARIVRDLLAPEGLLVYQDFQPFIKRCDVDKNGNLSPPDDYFSNGISESGPAYRLALDEKEQAELPAGRIQRWQLGQIVTAFASAPLQIEQLVDVPDWNDPRLPGTFILTARKS